MDQLTESLHEIKSNYNKSLTALKYNCEIHIEEIEDQFQRRSNMKMRRFKKGFQYVYDLLNN